MKKSPTKKKRDNLDCEVLVIGGGLAGLTLAGLLGRAGVDVVCVDRDAPVRHLDGDYDTRATAISYATRRVIEAAGAWEDIKDFCAPVEDIRVADGASPLFLHFSSEEDGKGKPFGWNLENLPLRKALFENIKKYKNVRHLAPAAAVDFFRDGEKLGAVLQDGTRISAPLMIGADGRASAVRRWLGIDVKKVDYGQTAIVCTIAHDKDHENVATEHFLPEGPFALLPLPGDKQGSYRSSVIWSVETKRAPSVLALSSKEFDGEMQRLCGAHLGHVRAVSAPRGYPLSLMHAETYIAPRVALMAEAAHAMHPIAGQGLNVSMRDIAYLAEEIVDRLKLGLDIGAESMLKDYDRIRHADVMLMTAFTDILNRLFSNDMKTIAVLRDTGLGIVEKIPSLKAFFARQAMGFGGKISRIVQNGRL